jgi:two-component sensor histidine kinase
MVSIADEERRQIGRNLHDGAQQRMIVLGHRIELARRKLEQDPEQAAEHLRHASEEARAAGAELRELARGLHPAGLAEYGLEPALAALAGRSPLPLEVAALPDRRLPEAVEVTIYYLVSEALSNAVKYAGATRVRVEITQGTDRVVAEVSDDGAGGADPAPGSGLAGLASRIEALGGTLDVTSPAGAGTRLRASISLAREWELEGGTPKVGQRLPVMDHRGRRHGTVEVVRIAVMPFGEVDAGSIEEHESGLGADEWRAAQRDYYDRCREQVASLLEEPGWRLTDGEPLVVLRFRLVE